MKLASSATRNAMLACFAILTSGCSAAYQGRINDAEVHLVDYFQRSDGAAALISTMDEQNIDHAYVMGLPVMKKWDASAPKAPRFVYGDDTPVYYYSFTDELIAREVESLPTESQARLHPFVSGFNTTDMNAAEHIERELNYRPGFWQGIGEVITRHDHLTALTSDEKPRANHPALSKVYDLAAHHDMPVLLHTNITSQREDNPLYLQELEQALSQHPDTRFLWAHAGTTTTLTRTITLTFLYQTVADLLSEHDNLYILASWSLIEVMMPQGQIDRRWLSLIEAYPERFMVGSDVVGQFQYQAGALAVWSPILSALPKHVADKMAYQNMLSVLPKKAQQK
jgi:predicted TIM-barrel fold metal-dependent hydrolase